MELKVWVEGIQRIVCGVTEATTCQDVVYALAHATGKTGRFTLVERWRHNERLLPPHERPLRVLAKWGEYAGDVQLLLRRSPSPPGGGAGATPPAADATAKLGDHILEPVGAKQQQQHHHHQLQRPPANTGQVPSPNGNQNGRDPLVRKSLTFSGGSGGGGSGGGGNSAAAPPNYTDPPPFRDSPNGKRDWSVMPRGVVKGVPQQNFVEHRVPATNPPDGGSKERAGQSEAAGKQSRSRPGASLSPSQPPQYQPPPSSSANPPQYQPPPTIHRTDPPQNGRKPPDPCDGAGSVAPAGQQHHHASQGDSEVATRGAPHPRTALASQESSACAMVEPSPPAAPSPSGHPRHPPPDQHHHQLPGPPPAAFRGPPMAGAHRQPSPSNAASPAEQQQQQLRSSVSPPRIPVPIHMGTPKSRRNLLSEFRRHDLEEELREDSFLGRGHQERVVYDARYKDLVRLVNLQREKLGRQQADLTQCDAEIMYWEEKQKDHQRQIEIIEREIQKAEFSGRDADEEAVQLNKLHLEDENAKCRQQEKMLQSELTLLRSKLSNCETELLQCKNKIRLLMDEIIESKRFLSKEEEERKQRETVMLHEIEDLQRDIDERIKQYDTTQVESVDKLDFDIRQLESAILEKKKQIESLVHEMKEANLASLTFTPSEEIRLLLEGGALKGPGSSRKIVGSPRQLENAVPTSKNPHGVWV